MLFTKDVSNRRVFVVWLIFFVSGMFMVSLLTPLSESFIEAESEIVASFCSPFNVLEAGLAFITETILFFYLPFRYKGKKGLKVGIVIWLALHMLTKNIPIVLYLTLMSYFYYSCIKIGRWKSVMLYHLIPNLLGILSCLI